MGQLNYLGEPQQVNAKNSDLTNQMDGNKSFDLFVLFIAKGDELY